MGRSGPAEVHWRALERLSEVRAVESSEETQELRMVCGVTARVAGGETKEPSEARARKSKERLPRAGAVAVGDIASVADVCQGSLKRQPLQPVAVADAGSSAVSIAVGVADVDA